MSKSVTEILNIEKPIIQAPMLWLTDAKFSGAVSNAGGLGVLGLNAGQTVPTKSLDETIERMRREIHKLKAITDKPFGINLGPGADPDKDPFTGPMIDLMIEEHVAAAVCAGNLVPKWFDLLKQNGIKIIYRALTPTVADTKAAVAAGADIIVATGFDEGGTVPTKVVGTFAIVPMIADAAGDVPVLAAGGVSDERTVKAAFALGAKGVFVGTALLVATESRLADNVKAQIVASDADDILMYRSEPAYYRSLPGKLPDHLNDLNDQGATGAEIFKASDGYNGMRVGMLQGDLEKGYASTGLGISLLHAVEPVATIIDRLAAGVPVGEA